MLVRAFDGGVEVAVRLRPRAPRLLDEFFVDPDLGDLGDTVPRQTGAGLGALFAASAVATPSAAGAAPPPIPAPHGIRFEAFAGPMTVRHRARDADDEQVLDECFPAVVTMEDRTRDDRWWVSVRDRETGERIELVARPHRGPDDG